MLYENNRIDISYRESQVLRNVARPYKEKVQNNERYLIDHKQDFWADFILYGHNMPLQHELADGLLLDMLRMDDELYNAFTEFINNLVITDKIIIMGNFLLSNGMGVHQMR